MWRRAFWQICMKVSKEPVVYVIRLLGGGKSPLRNVGACLPATQCHITQGIKLYGHLRENLKRHKQQPVFIQNYGLVSSM
jgi:hypothetical protein